MAQTRMSVPEKREDAGTVLTADRSQGFGPTRQVKYVTKCMKAGTKPNGGVTEFFG